MGTFLGTREALSRLWSQTEPAGRTATLGAHRHAQSRKRLQGVALDGGSVCRGFARMGTFWLPGGRNRGRRVPR